MKHSTAVSLANTCTVLATSYNFLLHDSTLLMLTAASLEAKLLGFFNFMKSEKSSFTTYCNDSLYCEKDIIFV